MCSGKSLCYCDGVKGQKVRLYDALLFRIFFFFFRITVVGLITLVPLQAKNMHLLDLDSESELDILSDG